MGRPDDLVVGGSQLELVLVLPDLARDYHFHVNSQNLGQVTLVEPGHIAFARFVPDNRVENLRPPTRPTLANLDYRATNR